MPDFAKVSHTSFSARDTDASAQWYSDVLGFQKLDEVAGEGWRANLLIHPPSATIIEFQQHDANRGDSFDPRRTGLDHIGLKVDDRGSLDEWELHFRELGVDHTPTVDREYGAVLTFRDPDGIQLEMFYRPDHP